MRITSGIAPVLLCLLPALALAKPDFPAPPDARVETVGDNVSISGNTMFIRQFYSSKKMERVNRFYHRRWAQGEDGREPGYVESEAMAPWHIISRVEDEYLMTVQIQPADNGGSWGYLAMSKLEPGKQAPDGAPEVPRMSDSRVLHQMDTVDSGQEGQTLLLSNPHSLASNVNYYRRHYQKHGWREDMNQPIRRANMHILAFTSGRYKINIMLTGDQNETQIVVNRIVHDIL